MCQRYKTIGQGANHALEIDMVCCHVKNNHANKKACLSPFRSCPNVYSSLYYKHRDMMS